MTSFVLIHGAADSAWYWHLLEPELRIRGHDVVAMDLPCDDDTAGMLEYADTVIDAVGDRTDLVVVAQSFGGFTAPLVCGRVPVDLRRVRHQSATPIQKPWPLDAWPDVPTRFLLCRDDRFFPADFMRRVARDRLGIAPDEIDGGHTIALSRPKELAGRMHAYATAR